MNHRSICVVTGSRAEYGLLYWLMKEIAAEPTLQLQVAVTGMHLAPEFGLTWKVIEADGFAIDARVDMLVGGDTSAAVSKSVGLGTIGFTDAFQHLRPDIVVLLGDRFETLAAAQAAFLMSIPIAHIHGGELTEGALDDGIRHALTKLSHLHFVAAESYRKRVIQLGEAPETVFCTGAPGLDHIGRTPRLQREQLASALGADFGPTNFLITYHPATLGTVSPECALDELLAALDSFPDAHCFFTRGNADAGGRALNARVERYVAGRPGHCSLFDSLGQQRYLSLLACVDAVIGNSSSGLMEAPLLGTPTVNVGPRQDGRLRASSVLDCPEQRDAIAAAIRHALGTEHRAIAAGLQSPYGTGDASRRIKNVLVGHALDHLVRKRFHDLP